MPQVSGSNQQNDIMGDKSPKSTQKKSTQKKSAAASVDQKKKQAVIAKQAVTKKK